jgi:apolipoprotein D and lipocalin family protein
MKLHAVLLWLLSAIVAPAQDREAREPSVVPALDLQRYAGTWYEIARYPNSFQKQCAGDVTATYTLLEDGEIRVVNRCRSASGEWSESEGRARRQSVTGPDAKLEVRFAPAFLSFLPMVWGSYWVIDLAPDYSFAVIGGPDREYLWILARTPQLPETTYKEILLRLATQGYDPGKLVRTRHTGA